MNFVNKTFRKQRTNRAINQSKGYENEVLPRARAEAIELTESALAYRDSKIAESRGEAERFNALLAAYQAAPEVTRKRLYLETMEAVLPNVETVVVEEGTSQVLPFLPIGSNAAPPWPENRPGPVPVTRSAPMPALPAPPSAAAAIPPSKGTGGAAQ